MKEIIFEVREDEVDGGYNASALGQSIHTQGDSLPELRRNIREAVETHFEDNAAPHVIRLIFLRDEVLAL